jgi:hypothetical protein
VTGITGPSGPKGKEGPAGPTGPSGINSPLVFGPYSGESEDSGNCENNYWAKDTYKKMFIVEPQLDGTFIVDELVTGGKFTTTAGVDQPNPGKANCGTPAALQKGGVTGTFYGDTVFSIPATGIFNPTATYVSNKGEHVYESEEHFAEAFFGVKPTGEGTFNFHYIATEPEAHGTWNESHVAGDESGNIIG